MMKNYNTRKGQQGKYTERLIDMTNKQYLNANMAKVNKIPEPTQITKKHANGKVEGFVKRGEMVDYVGIAHRLGFIAFDSKETKVSTRFDLNRIHGQQLEYLRDITNMGGFGFLLVNFLELKEIYLLPYKFVDYWAQSERKSIPIDSIRKNCVTVDPNNGYTLDYLTGIMDSEF